MVVGNRFRELLEKLTANRYKGALLGATVTSIIQSSTATTVIVVGLVNAGVISFSQSLGIIIGSNVGTTVTAQLIAFKLTSFAPIFIILGFLVGLVGGKYKFLGKPLFYFGLVFFSLALISDALEPLQGDPIVTDYLSKLSNVFIALAVGTVLTTLFQSSSVTTGLVVLLAQGGFLTLDQGIPLILGANLGTTTTAALASLKMDLYPRRVAAAHILFNIGGVLLFLPFLSPFASTVAQLGGSPAHQIANAHLIFNLVAALIFLIAIQPFKKLVARMVPGKEQEVLFKTKYLKEKLPESTDHAFELIEKELHHSLDLTLSLFDESMKILKTNNPDKFQRVSKLEAVNDYLDERIEKSILELSRRRLCKKEARRTMLLVRISNVMERLGDSGKRLGSLSGNITESGTGLPTDAMKRLNKIYSKFKHNTTIVKDYFSKIPEDKIERMRQNDKQIIQMINESYGEHLELLSSENSHSGSMFVELISVIEAANAKVREIRKLSEMYLKVK
ncbi:Na/Pi cotransporter family protein [Candidatus Micrarchaeota archaeon]|nr:MAG: Na/Pi cotransporter family protein [Candidatus Micrarchaeota archaeon]